MQASRAGTRGGCRHRTQAREIQPLQAIGPGGRNLARQVDEAGVAAGELLHQVVLGHAEDRGDPRGGAHRVLDEVGRRGDVVGGLGHRQHDAVAVHDRPAPRGHDRGADLLRDRGGRKLAALEHADLHGAQAGEGEQGQEAGEEQADPAIDEPRGHCVCPVGAAGAVVVAGAAAGDCPWSCVRGRRRRRRRAGRLLLLGHRGLLRRRGVRLLLLLHGEHRLRPLLGALRVRGR